MPSVLNLGRQHCSGRAPKILLIIQYECLLELHRVCHLVSDDVVSFGYVLMLFGYTHKRLYFPNPHRSEYDKSSLCTYALIF